MPLITRSEYLEIDGVPLATPAWEVAAGGLLPLLQGPAIRGTDRLLPGVPGVKARKRRATVTLRSVPMKIFVDVDLDGDPYDDPAEGLTANVDYLRANVADPTNIGDGTRTATLHLKDGSTRSGAVHVESLELGGDDENAVLAVLTLSIPGGALT